MLEAGLDGREGRDEKGLAFEEQVQRLVIQQGPVLDGVDTGAEGVLHAFGAVRVGRDAPAGAGGFLHAGPQLLRRELRCAGGGPRCQHAARRDKLDDVRARANLLAHRLYDLGRPVGLAPDEPGVPARHADHQARVERAGARDDPGLDRAGDRDRDVLAGADVPDRRDPGFQRRAHVGDGLDGGDGRIVLFERSNRIRARVQAVVNVAINQAREKGEAMAFDHP